MVSHESAVPNLLDCRKGKTRQRIRSENDEVSILLFHYTMKAFLTQYLIIRESTKHRRFRAE